ncbi:MAG: hypothetical protein ACK5LM_05365 [Lactovum sp.]
MSLNICNMLYVEDVKKNLDFWLAIGFVEVKRQGEGREFTVVLASHEKSAARLQLWDINYIREVSAEVAEMKPSLLFVVEDLEYWHEKISTVTDTVSEINPQPFKNFNFQSPDGSYYAFAESEIVEG